MYGLVTWFYFQRFIAYPTEVVAALARRFMDLLLLVLFWQAFTASGAQGMDIRTLIGYFLVAGAVGEMTMGTTMRMGRELATTIKTGEITQYMIRPVPLLPYMYAYSIGNSGIQIALSVVLFVVGIILSPPVSVIGVIAFVAYFAVAVVIAFALNVSIGVMALVTTEAVSYRNVLIHVTKIMSGALVPLSLFPAAFQQVVMVLPFAAMAYAPSQSLRASTWGAALGWHYIVALAWAVGLFLMVVWLWKRMLRRYEAIGQ